MIFIKNIQDFGWKNISIDFEKFDGLKNSYLAKSKLADSFLKKKAFGPFKCDVMLIGSFDLILSDRLSTYFHTPTCHNPNPQLHVSLNLKHITSLTDNPLWPPRNFPSSVSLLSINPRTCVTIYLLFVIHLSIKQAAENSSSNLISIPHLSSFTISFVKFLKLSVRKETLNFFQFSRVEFILWVSKRKFVTISKH